MTTSRSARTGTHSGISRSASFDSDGTMRSCGSVVTVALDPGRALSLLWPSSVACFSFGVFDFAINIPPKHQKRENLHRVLHTQQNFSPVLQINSFACFP